ncbi:MAG TPA: ABC transporter permease, partial [Actinomycetes bacterium]
SLVVFTLALLGGNFIYLAQLPDLLQRLSLLTPNGWALRGFVDLVADGGGLATVAAPVAVTAAFGVATGLVALVRARRMVVA